MSREITLKDQFDVIRPRFEELTDPTRFKKEISFALQIFGKNQYLSGSTTESKLEAVLNVAQVGLTLDPVLKLAYLVPRRDNGNVVCCLEPSYQGLCKLVTDTGSASRIEAKIVYEEDEFDLVEGTETRIVHRPKFKSENILLVYAVAKLADGSKMVEVMTLKQIEEIRGMSESFKAYLRKDKKITCVWVQHFGEMARKTVLRRLVKYLPKTEMWDKLGQAINLDESDYTASLSQITHIESLLMTAAIDPEEQSSYFRELNMMTASRASEVIDYLNENQIDPITSGANYNQTDIKDKLNRETD